MNSNLLLNIGSFHALVLLIPAALAMLYWKPQSWLVVFAFCSGVIMGFIDLHSSEPQLPATLLLLFGLFFGFASPARAWLPAVLLAAWIPIASFIGILAQAQTRDLISHGVGSLLAFVFSFAGSYLGAFIARRSFHV